MFSSSTRSDHCLKCQKTPADLGSTQTLKQCAKCRGASYCSRKCQVDDWKAHKKACSEASKNKNSAPTLPPPPRSFPSSAVTSSRPQAPSHLPPYEGIPQSREDRRSAEQVMKIIAEFGSPDPRLDAIEQAGWGYFPDPRLPPGTPSRRDFMESKNSDNIDYDSPHRSAFITTIARMTQGNNIGARNREAAANAAFEREYTAGRDYLVGRHASPFKTSAVRGISDSKQLLAALVEKFSAYEFAIDAYRLRLTDENGVLGLLGLPKRKYKPIQHFGQFLDEAHSKATLPAWWIAGGELLNMMCIRLAMKTDGGACILQCFGSGDMSEKYGYDGVVSQLRRFAADVYGQSVSPLAQCERLKGRGLWIVEDNGEWQMDMKTFWNTLGT